jgi:S-adenosylmethionine:tRNA-ribosyltransferase-isomerase (queuine synthetase)
MFSDLNFQSKIVILDVMKDYDEQFEILKEDCQEYDQFMYLLDYLRELPLYVMEDMKVIKAQEVEDNFEDYLIGVPISKGKITYNQQENIYKESKELGINPTSFFKEDYIYGIR